MFAEVGPAPPGRRRTSPNQGKPGCRTLRDVDSPAPDPVAQVLGRLLQQPEPQRDLELERALQRLQAARSDSSYLLMHRVMVLEAALQQLRQPPSASAQTLPARPAATRSFLRDAAVVAAGVVGGQALWQGISGASAVAGVEGLEGLEGLAGPDLDGWL